MSSCISLRHAGPDDIDQIAAVTHKSWHLAYDNVMPNEFIQLATHKFFIERCVDLISQSSEGTGHHCLVLVEDQRIIGVGAAGPYRINASPPEDRVSSLLKAGPLAEFYRGYVEPRPFVAHLARLIFSGLTDLLRKDGFNNAGLWTQRDNLYAIRFGQAFSGKVLTEREAVVFGQPIPNQREVFVLFDLERAQTRCRSVKIEPAPEIIAQPLQGPSSHNNWLQVTNIAASIEL